MLIRTAAKKDAQQILDIYAPYVLNTNISFETVVPSIDEMERRIEGVLAYNPWLAIEEEGCMLGYAYASKHRERAAYRWSSDVSIYVRQECRGKGAGRVLYRALIALLELQGYYNLYAGICLPNAASVGIHESFGFRKIAHYNKVGYKSGQWHDVGWWELPLREHADEPDEPLPFNLIREEELTALLHKALEAVR